MPKITLLFGVLLTALALYGYFGADADHRSFTAWIPAFVGIPLLICGGLAMKDDLRKHAMHGAAVFALLGTLAAGGRGLMKIGVLFADDPAGNKRAVAMVLIMFVLCLAFMILCIRSFIEARKRREAGEGSSAAKS